VELGDECEKKKKRSTAASKVYWAAYNLSSKEELSNPLDSNISSILLLV
jgi:hypothetical protein